MLCVVCGVLCVVCGVWCVVVVVVVDAGSDVHCEQPRSTTTMHKSLRLIIGGRSSGSQDSPANLPGP